MATEYTIYLVNESTSTQVFWCFLERPAELASDPQVFANSSVSLAVQPHSPATNTFTIPVQYVTGAGASNNAVNLNIKVNSQISQNAELNDKFQATYADVPPQMGPTLAKSGTGAGKNSISISSNPFNKPNNEAQGWFSSMSFGIQTAQGFIGMTWSPDPNQTRTLTPTLKFYVAVGTYGSNTLASWTTISTDSAEMTVPTDFALNKTTVTYTTTGQWEVTRGAPSTLSLAVRRSQLSSVIHTQSLLTQALLSRDDSDLDALAGYREALSSGRVVGTGEVEKVKTVKWDDDATFGDDSDGILSGTLTVGTAITAAFALFVLSGIDFTIDSAPVGGRTIHFHYSGNQSAERIKELLVAGARIVLDN